MLAITGGGKPFEVHSVDGEPVKLSRRGYGLGIGWAKAGNRTGCHGS